MRRSNDAQPALGAAVRAGRKEIGATQRALAKDAGLTTTHLSNLERGRTNPSWSTVGKLAGALDLSIASLARRSELLDRRPDSADKKGSRGAERRQAPALAT